MRAFYTSTDGRTADLCQMIGRDTTRLTIRDKIGSMISRDMYEDWSKAIAALKNCGTWENDLLGYTI